MELQNKKILLGITGSIAAYKTAHLVRALIKEGAEVKVLMTPASLQFVAPLTLSTLSKNEVHHQLSENDSWSNHVMLGRWADLMLIAPLSCNTLGKMAAGICDNLLMAVYLSSTCPVVLAPAMDEDMWLHGSTQNNLKKLESFGNEIIPVGNGELASGLVGPGRMAEPEQITRWLVAYFSKKHDLHNKRVLITAGPTREPIDPVRYISNHSSGKMGIALAKECQNRGALVTLVIGPVSEKIPDQIDVVKVSTAAEMYDACISIFKDFDIAIMSAAVADYTVSHPAEQKIKKSGAVMQLELVKTKDILQSLGEQKKDHQILVGFALETENESANALQKLKAKNADMIVLNSMNDVGAGFGTDTNKISIFDKEGNVLSFELKSKESAAADIVNAIIHSLHA